MVRGSVGIGRRARLRILWVYSRVGSSPIFRTTVSRSDDLLFFRSQSGSVGKSPLDLFLFHLTPSSADEPLYRKNNNQIYVKFMKMSIEINF